MKIYKIVWRAIYCKPVCSYNKATSILHVYSYIISVSYAQTQPFNSFWCLIIVHISSTEKRLRGITDKGTSLARRQTDCLVSLVAISFIDLCDDFKSDRKSKSGRKVPRVPCITSARVSLFNQNQIRTGTVKYLSKKINCKIMDYNAAF